MTDWVDIANSAVAPKAPVTSELMTALRDNTVVSMWEDVTTVYDSTIDGTVASVTTPTFVDGWDYGLTWVGIQGSGSLRVILNRAVGAEYLSFQNFSNISNTFIDTTALVTLNPSVPYTGGLFVHHTRYDYPAQTTYQTGYMDLGTNSQAAFRGIYSEINATKYGKVQSMTINSTNSSISGGIIKLRRKRNEYNA